MKPTLPLIAAFVALLTLSACGGGGDASTPASNDSAQVTALVKTDTVVGTGAEAVNGKSLSVFYTLWLYSASAADHKGTLVETNVGSNAFTLVLGAGGVITGWDLGLVGMKEGGKRTLTIPAGLAYGSKGSDKVPPNTALVFDVSLVTVK